MLPAFQGYYVYPSTSNYGECVLESYAHVTITHEAFAASPIANTVSHVLRTSPCISRGSGDNGIDQTTRCLLEYVAIHYVFRSVMVTCSVVVKFRCADRWP